MFTYQEIQFLPNIISNLYRNRRDGVQIIRKKIIKMGAFKDCHRFYNILSPARLNLTSKLFLVFQFVSKTVHFKSFQFHWKLLCNKATKLVFGFCNDYIAIIGWPKLSCRCVMLCFNDTMHTFRIKIPTISLFNYNFSYLFYRVIFIWITKNKKMFRIPICFLANKNQRNGH